MERSRCFATFCQASQAKASIPAGGQLTVVGDLHGQYWDFLNLLSMAGRAVSICARVPFRTATAESTVWLLGSVAGIR